MDAQADPISHPTTYRQSILSALGPDDPALVQAATVQALHDLVGSAGESLRVRPYPREWSALECIGHLVDSELVASARYRWILAEIEPDVVGYDQDLWVSRLRHGDEDPLSLIALFAALRRANLDLWARSGVGERMRIGLHRERGPESYELIFRLAAGHDRVHLGQAQAALAAVRAVLQGAPRS